MSVEAKGTESRRSLLLRGGAVAAGGIAVATALAVPTAGAQVGASMPVYLPLDPVRVYDSRVTGGKISSNQERDLQTYLSANILAVTVNLTVTETEGAGFLAVFPGDIVWPGTSSVNWFGPNQNLSNNAFVFVPDDGVIRVRCGGLRTHFVIDLIGASTFMQVATSLTSPGEFRVAAKADAGCDSNSPVDPRLVS